MLPHALSLCPPPVDDAITKELADTLRRNKTIDWQKRESARAKMRMLIKKLLKKHTYPSGGHGGRRADRHDAVQPVDGSCYGSLMVKVFACRRI